MDTDGHGLLDGKMALDGFEDDGHDEAKAGFGDAGFAVFAAMESARGVPERAIDGGEFGLVGEDQR